MDLSLATGWLDVNALNFNSKDVSAAPRAGGTSPPRRRQVNGAASNARSSAMPHMQRYSAK